MKNKIKHQDKNLNQIEVSNLYTVNAIKGGIIISVVDDKTYNLKFNCNDCEMYITNQLL